MNKCLWLAGATVAAVLAVSLPIKSANADPITGQISLIGNDIVLVAACCGLLALARRRRGKIA